jgi:Core-2/I-Branching enzyme
MGTPTPLPRISSVLSGRRRRSSALPGGASGRGHAPRKQWTYCLFLLVVVAAIAALITLDITIAARGGFGTSSAVEPWSSPETEDSGDPRIARIAYSITVAPEGELPGLTRLLKAIYDPRNLYIIHLDPKARPAVKQQVKRLLVNMWKPRKGKKGKAKSNIRLVDNPVSVSWGGFSLLLSTIYCLSIARWAPEPWDYWINVSPSDMPLLPQNEIMQVFTSTCLLLVQCKADCC